jgi:hypothetical protein
VTALYDTRIATRITSDADRRLRLAAVAARSSLSAVLTDAIERALPPADELAARLGSVPGTEVSPS